MTFSLFTACLLLAACSAPAAEAEAGGFQSLFNGHDLAGWKEPKPNPFWKTVDGILVGESSDNLKGNMLYTEKSFKDFILETEARWNGDIDSGIMFRKPELQLQIGISRSLKTDMSCSFYVGGKEKYPMAGRAKNIEKLLKPGDWNRIRLQAKGDAYTVWLNGELVTQYTNARYLEPGPIGLQIHPGVKMKVEFRGLRIKELH